MTGPRARSGRPHVVVVGAGLAGLSAALRCLDAGARVTVIERRRRYGGLTWSFPHDGTTIDNGQHVFLRCCTAYLEFLKRIGSDGDVAIQDRLDVTVLRPSPTGGRPDTGRLRRIDLPAPWHLGPTLLAYRLLPVSDRLRLGLAAVPLRRLDLADPRVDRETFGAWLTRHHQSPGAIAALWDLITVATVNLPAAEASLAMGAKVFQTGLLTDSAAGDVGWARIPLQQLHGDRAVAALRRGGAEVCAGERVTGIEALDSLRDDRPGRQPGGRGFTVRTEHRRVDADGVVVALPHHAVAEVMPAGSFAGRDVLDRLGTSPIVNVHVFYDRRVTDLPLAAGIGTQAQWIFDRTVSSGSLGATARGQGQYLAVSVSAAAAELAEHPQRLALAMTAELTRLFPDAAGARVVDTLVTKERTATFRATPGTAGLRPGPKTLHPALTLAGAWTDTGWPATMEGAVRSGVAAAGVVMDDTALLQSLPEEVA